MFRPGAPYGIKLCTQQRQKPIQPPLKPKGIDSSHTTAGPKLLRAQAKTGRRRFCTPAENLVGRFFFSSPSPLNKQQPEKIKET